MPIKKMLPKPAVKPSAPPAKTLVQSAPPATSEPPLLPRISREPNLKELARNEKKLGPRPEPSKLPGAEKGAASLAGQTWLLVKKKGEVRTCVFFEDGSLSFSGSPGRWLQHGAAMTFDVNDRYVDYIGVIHGDTAEGSAKNISGLSWTWTAKRAP